MAERLQDQGGYDRAVLSGVAARHPVTLFPPEAASSTAGDVLAGIGLLVGAVALAALALYGRRLPLLRGRLTPGVAAIRPLESIQSGVVNDYVTLIVLGVACIGAVLAYVIR